MKKKSVLLIGATGLVGRIVLGKLLHNNDINEVRIITRRETGIVNEKLKELVVDFELIEPFNSFMQCDVLINCMGSTMKKAGSKAAFERFDYFYPHKIATICHENGTSKMVLLSAMGAHLKSSFFYSRVKARLEQECVEIGFDELIIIQPSLIIGERAEHRLGEKMFMMLSGVMSAIMPLKYKPVTAEKLASTIVHYTLTQIKQKVKRIDKKNFVK